MPRKRKPNAIFRLKTTLLGGHHYCLIVMTIFSQQWQEVKEETISTAHSPSISVFEFKQYARASIYINTQYSLGFFIMSMHSDIQHIALNLAQYYICLSPTIMCHISIQHSQQCFILYIWHCVWGITGIKCTIFSIKYIARMLYG